MSSLILFITKNFCKIDRMNNLMTQFLIVGQILDLDEFFPSCDAHFCAEGAQKQWVDDRSGKCYIAIIIII